MELCDSPNIFQEKMNELLSGAEHVRACTDHNNLTYKSINAKGVLRWQLILEDFSPNYFSSKALKIL